MNKLGLNEIREKFLNFYESKGHLRLPSFPLIPHNDASLLLINSGMAPLKPYFKGTETPPRKRVTTCQKCIRTPDIDNVGKTARHGTFFEMLGNFSFGDYFKREAITWAWEFLTKVMEIPSDRLYITVFQDDDEAYDIWSKEIGVSTDNIYRMGKADNFWEHGTGPCGPCSEIHYDRGEKYGCGKPDCKVGCDCDRFIEVWNLVFTQFDRQEDGSYTRLTHPNIDTGMGLERLACVMQGVDNLFEVDTVRKILDTVCQMSDKKYGENVKDDISIRKITDHIRSTVMMIGDGVIPSNESRGYVLRRLLRGAARHGRRLGIKGNFLHELADTVFELSGEAYPNILDKKEYIKKVIRLEEERFASTIEQGMNMLSEYMDNMSEGDVLPGSAAFKLHDTYGFPLDITKDILIESGMTVDEAGFKKEMDNQRHMAREAIKNRESSWASSETINADDLKKTEFKGYDTLECRSSILRIYKSNGDIVTSASEGENIIFMTAQTSFYAESGGQFGDKGICQTESGKIIVENTVKTNSGVWKHMGYVESGCVEEDEECELIVDRNNRLATQRNHSSAHLLQHALKMVLGDHVHQAGSSVSSDRMRFDFNCMQAMTDEEIRKVEDIVNAAILNNYEVTTDVLPIEEAKKTGAMALFGEKYGDFVRVVSMGDFSKELCGGTHVKHTDSIGTFKIVHEGAVAAGVRRIEAVTGQRARELLLSNESILNEVSGSLKVSPSELPDKVGTLLTQYKQAVKELDTIKKANILKNIDSIIANAVIIKGVSVIAVRLDDCDSDSLRELAEKVRDRVKCSLVIATSSANGKAAIVAMADNDAIKLGMHCGKIVKKAAALCGGGGGGRPDYAQAGGKNPENIDDMLKNIESLL